MDLYASPMGNSDLPYPYILGKTHVYLLLEEKMFPRSAIDAGLDAYAQFYGFEKAMKKGRIVKIPEAFVGVAAREAKRLKVNAIR